MFDIDYRSPYVLRVYVFENINFVCIAGYICINSLINVHNGWIYITGNRTKATHPYTLQANPEYTFCFIDSDMNFEIADALWLTLVSAKCMH